MRIFVTGAPGFIDLALVPESIQTGYSGVGAHTFGGRSIENFAGHGRRRHNLLTTAQTP